MENKQSLTLIVTRGHCIKVNLWWAVDHPPPLPPPPSSLLSSPSELPCVPRWVGSPKSRFRFRCRVLSYKNGWPVLSRTLSKEGQLVSLPQEVPFDQEVFEAASPPSRKSPTVSGFTEVPRGAPVVPLQGLLPPLPCTQGHAWLSSYKGLHPSGFCSSSLCFCSLVSRENSNTTHMLHMSLFPR